MRTTLTLDDDVAKQVDTLRRARGVSLRELVNAALRIGLARLQSPGTAEEEFRQTTRDLGECLLPSLDDVGEALSIAEGEQYR